MVNVKTSNGEINGIHKDGIDTFLGIPYATLSNGRFNHSKVYKQWSEAYTCNTCSKYSSSTL